MDRNFCNGPFANIARRERLWIEFVESTAYKLVEIYNKKEGWGSETYDEIHKTLTHCIGNPPERERFIISETKDGHYIQWTPRSSMWIDSLCTFIGKGKMDIACHVCTEWMDWGDYGTHEQAIVINSHYGWIGISEDETKTEADVRYAVRQALLKVKRKWMDMNRRARALVLLFEHVANENGRLTDLVEGIADENNLGDLASADTEVLEELAQSIGFRQATTVKDRMRRAFARGPEIMERRMEERYG